MSSRPVEFSARLLCLAILVVPALRAQQQPAPSGPPPYTLRTQSRIVLLDVTATDANGNPVRDLPQSAFHITDAKRPQAIASFDEHSHDTSPAPLPPAHARGTYSNDFLLHTPPVLNILLIDISNLAIEDQMFLRLELRRLVDTLSSVDPARAQPLAIYTRASGASILLQNFTTDRDLLHAAVDRAVPRIVQPNGYLDDLYTLHQITSTVAELPGRKNLLWFSGGVRIGLSGDAMAQPALYRDNAQVRQIYDTLEASRIAVYPIDARGLTVTGGLPQMLQHNLMDEVARATGGHAFYNTNGLALSASRVIHDDRSFYTLTYVPTGFRADHHWHAVQVSVDRPGVRLSYREGYFSDNPLPQSSPTPAARETRARLLADGSLSRDAGLPPSSPIVFTAQVLPVSDPALSGVAASTSTDGSPQPRPAGNPEAATSKAQDAPDPPASRGLRQPAMTVLTPAATSHHGSVPYSIRYSVPADVFHLQMIDGKPSIALDVAAIAFNLNGTAVAHSAQKITFRVNPVHIPIPAGTRIPLEQQIALQRGDLTLYLAIWDPTSGRMGNLQIPLVVQGDKH